MIKTPYLLFLGDVQDQLAAKTANGIAYWRPENCIGQLRMEGCKADVGLLDLTLREAKAMGAQTLIVGVANRGGIIKESWIPTIKSALNLGFELASGLHQRLADHPLIRMGISVVHDVRHPTKDFNVGTGEKRSGKRILTVGTDCSVGKMYAALAIEREMKKSGHNADFRATGQTGILISGSGVSVDAVVSDFISGAIEDLCPTNDKDHWDIVEGQGSLLHPSYAGVTLGLIHGAQPDYLVVCHDPSRITMRGLPNRKMPSIEECIVACLLAARVVNPTVEILGICLNTSTYSEIDATEMMKRMETKYHYPVCDPVRTGVTAIVNLLDIIESTK